VWHAYERKEIHVGFWWVNVKRFRRRPTVRRDREILLKRILEKLRYDGDGLD